MTTMTDEDEYMDMDENLLKLPQKQHFSILEDEKEENENKRTKFTSFSELSDDQLNVIFGEGLRFEICSAFITYEMFDRLKLFGAIQVAAADFSPDPLLQHNVSFDVFNREFNDPLRVPCYGDHVLHTLNYNSLPVSSTSAVRIAAKLYLTSDKVDDIENLSDDYDREPPVKKDVEGVDDLMMKIWADFGILEQESFNLKTACTLQTTEAECVDNETEWDDNEAECVDHEAECVDHEAECVDHEAECVDNESECVDNEAKCVDNDSGCVVDNNEAECLVDNEAFQVCDKHVIIELSDKPNGGSGYCEIQGKHGSLKLFYVAVKYAVDADLELELCLTSKETKVTGTIMAYYSQDFDYDDPEFDCQVTLFEASAPAFVTPGRIKLIRSVLAVPAKSSLIIGTNLYDSTTVVQILTDTFKFPVPRDCRSSYGSIVGDGCSLNLKVNWKQPSQEVKIPSPPSNSSSVSRDLDEITALDTLAMADSDERNRWSLQEEIAKVFNTSLKRTFKIQEAVPCISTCTKEDGGDYLCSSVMHIWPEIKKTHLYKGPKHAGLAVKDNIMVSDYNDMMERCVVCGPGFVKFKLCRKWIAQSIHTMLTVGIETWAPKLNVEKVIICFMSQNIAEEMNMGHLRSKFIEETLALMHEFSGVVVLRKRFHDNVDSLDNKYICFCEYYTREIPDLFWENGLLIGSEGDELPLVDLTDYGHDLCLDQADCVVHVGHRYSMCEMCINAAAFSAGRIYPNVIHVGIGLVRCDDFDTEVGTIVDLLDEAKSRCKALLVRQGMADEWTAAEREHAAEALKHGAFKYAHLMNNRLINHTFSFDQMLNEEGNTAVYLHYTHARICSIIRNSNNDIKESMAESLILKHDDERELGLHLLRFTEVLGEVCTNFAPHILCDYFYGLCKKFNSLHSSVSQVVGSSEERSKLLLCKATEVVMRKCFDLLGITPIHKIYR